MKSIFTALYVMPARTSYEKAVCPSVKRVDCDKMEESSVQIFIPYKIPFNLYSDRKMVGGGRPFYLKIWVILTQLERKRRFSVDIRS